MERKYTKERKYIKILFILRYWYWYFSLSVFKTTLGNKSRFISYNKFIDFYFCRGSVLSIWYLYILSHPPTFLLTLPSLPTPPLAYYLTITEVGAGKNKLFLSACRCLCFAFHFIWNPTQRVTKWEVVCYDFTSSLPGERIEKEVNFSQ